MKKKAEKAALSTAKIPLEFSKRYGGKTQITSCCLNKFENF